MGFDFIQKATFEVPSLPSGWGNPFQPAQKPAPLADSKPAYHDNEDLKKRYGVELANRNNQVNSAFNAACAIFPNDTNAALWVTREWLSDPIVLKSREDHLKTLEQKAATLDRDAFAARLLELSEARNVAGTAYVYDDKERVNLLKLYAEVRGFTGKQEAPIINNNLVQGLTIKLVKPETKEQVLDTTPTPNTNNQNLNDLPIKLKLVG